MNNQITLDQFSAIQKMFDYFNDKLFGGKLNQCLLNLSRMQRAHGFFAPERWIGTNNDDHKVHEISLCPDSMSREPKKVTSTLVHEMVHLWQEDFGKPSKGGYHNRQWAQMMKEIGLYPSSTAEEGGKETGRTVSHYIIEGGEFDKAYEAMPKEFLYPFIYVPAEKTTRPSQNKSTYVCPGCGSKIWGKSGLLVQCKECELDYIEQV